jgi:hypothetical protein
MDRFEEEHYLGAACCWQRQRWVQREHLTEVACCCQKESYSEQVDHFEEVHCSEQVGRSEEVHCSEQVGRSEEVSCSELEVHCSELEASCSEQEVRCSEGVSSVEEANCSGEARLQLSMVHQKASVLEESLHPRSEEQLARTLASKRHQ